VVHSSWHPARSSDVAIGYRERRGNDEIVVFAVSDEAAVVIFARMFDRGSAPV
jgi:hypothetical protein